MKLIGNWLIAHSREIRYLRCGFQQHGPPLKKRLQPRDKKLQTNILQSETLLKIRDQNYVKKKVESFMILSADG